MKWRNEPPDKPGWWWVKRSNGQRGIYEVKRLGKRGLYYKSGAWERRVDTMTTWAVAGPIAEPEEEG